MVTRQLKSIEDSLDEQDMMRAEEMLGYMLLGVGIVVVYGINKFLIQPIRHLALWLNGDNYTFDNGEGIFPHWVKTEDEPRYKTPNLL